jgi:hypothetical protein
LATAKARIDCESGNIEMALGDKTNQFNIFEVSKKNKIKCGLMEELGRIEEVMAIHTLDNLLMANSTQTQEENHTVAGIIEDNKDIQQTVATRDEEDIYEFGNLLDDSHDQVKTQQCPHPEFLKFKVQLFGGNHGDQDGWIKHPDCEDEIELWGETLEMLDILEYPQTPNSSPNTYHPFHPTISQILYPLRPPLY